MLDPEGEEGVLLPDDLAGYLQNGPGPLVEALHQPVGRGKAVGDEGLFRLGPGGPGHLGVIALVHQEAGQGVAVQIDPPAAIAVFAHEHIGHHRLHRGGAEGGTGARRQSPQLRGHVAKILVIHAADPPKGGKIALGEQVEMVEQGLHGRVQPIAVRQLEHEAFADIPGEDAHGIEALKLLQHGLHQGLAAAQPTSHLDGLQAEVAALVHTVDEDHGHGPLGRGQTQHLQLLGQVIRQGDLPSEDALQPVGVHVPAAAVAGLGPVHRAAHVGGRLGRGGIAGGIVAGGAVMNVIGAGIELGLGPSGRVGHGIGIVTGDVVGRLRGLRLRLIPGQKGVLLQLLLDKDLELEIGELQKLYRLLQLRRDDQTLALPELKTRTKRHV